MTAGAILLLIAAVSTLSAAPSPACATGMAQIQRGDYISAQQSLWQCILSGPGKQTEAFYLGLTYRELKNYDAGLAQTAAPLQQSPGDINLLYLLAFFHYRKNETKESTILLTRAYHLDPNDWRIHQLFAFNYALFLMPEAVEMEFKTAIRLNHGNAELHSQPGHFYFSGQHFQKSIEEVNQAIAIFPNYPEAYDSLGPAYEGLQDSQKAAENPHSPQANYQLGRAMRVLKRHPEAERYFENTSAADPQYSYAYFQLAALVRARGDRERAAKLMEKCKLLMEKNNNSNRYNSRTPLG